MLAIFNLFSLVVGAAIGAVARTWSWVIGLSIALGAALNMSFDVMEYGHPLLHPNSIMLDSLSFLVFATIVFSLRQWYRKRKLAENAVVAKT